MTTTPTKRLTIVQDTEGRWYVRSLVSSTHDLTCDVMRYVCHDHLAGPYISAMDAALWVERYEAKQAIEALARIAEGRHDNGRPLAAETARQAARDALIGIGRTWTRSVEG